MSKNSKGMICLLNSWEWEDQRVNGVKPDCRNHRHLSSRRLYERIGDARFADAILAHIYDVRYRLLGFIVEVAKRVRWADHSGDQRCGVRMDSACWKLVSAHLNRFQTMIDAGQRPFEIVTLPIKPVTPPRDAAISETLRSHSPCALTAKESELNAEWRFGRAERTPRSEEG
jgi:hypothetical protein